MKNNQIFVKLSGIGLAFFLLILPGCTKASTPAATTEHNKHETTGDVLTLPAFKALTRNGEPLQVVATTSIIGDVVSQVGREAIELTTLMAPGEDPHSYEPSARELTAVADADVIFVNGWGLEEALVHDLAEIGSGVPIVPISARIEPLLFGANSHDHTEADHKEADQEEIAHEEAEHEHNHTGADPHVWFSVHHVKKWSENVTHVLSELDPDNAETYENNAAAYQEELTALEMYAVEQLAQIPEEKRFLVTNHDSLSYFAHEYGFELIGTVIPGASTLTEPSANDLAGLVAEMEAHHLCTIFTETTVSDTLAQTVAAELSACDHIQVIKVYTGSIGAAGSGADSYVSMFRANVDAIVAGLK